MAEEVTVTFSLNGEDLEPIKVPELKQDKTYSHSLSAYCSGYVFYKGREEAAYRYSVRIERPKTAEEEGKKDDTS